MHSLALSISRILVISNKLFDYVLRFRMRHITFLGILIILFLMPMTGIGRNRSLSINLVAVTLGYNLVMKNGQDGKEMKKKGWIFWFFVLDFSNLIKFIIQIT
jgi:hypothetical protein